MEERSRNCMRSSKTHDMGKEANETKKLWDTYFLLLLLCRSGNKQDQDLGWGWVRILWCDFSHGVIVSRPITVWLGLWLVHLLTVTMVKSFRGSRFGWMCACCGGILVSADYLSKLESETQIVINLFLIMCEKRVRDLWEMCVRVVEPWCILDWTRILWDGSIARSAKNWSFGFGFGIKKLA